MGKKLNPSHMEKKYSTCETRRNTKIEVQKAEKEEFKRAYITRKAIFLVKKVGGTLTDAMALVDAEAENLRCLSETTRLLLVDEVKTLVRKYLDASPEESLDAPLKNLSFHGMEFVFAPSFLRVTDTPATEEEINDEGELVSNLVNIPCVEVTNFTAGKQKYSSSAGKGRENSGIFFCPTALCSILYGKEVLNGRKGVVRVQFDACKTSEDKHGDYSRPWVLAADEKSGTLKANRVFFEVMFDESGNLVEDNSTWSIHPHVYDDRKLWKNYEETIDLWNSGKETCKGTCACEECELNGLCNYAERPIPKEVKKEAEAKAAVSVRLTEEQAKVVDFNDGVCLVDAGAGSGKSHSVCLRIVRLLEEGTNPEDIMLLSFSNAAVSVLLERVTKMVKEQSFLEIDCSKIKIATFNSVGNEIVVKNFEELGFSEAPKLIDSIESYDLILESIDWDDPIEGLDYKNPNMAFNASLGVGKALEKEFARIRDNNIGKEDFLTAGGDKKIWETYERYVALLKAGNWVDFSDQSNLVMDLIDRYPYLVADMYPVEHIVVDEFQDSNDFQMMFIRALCSSINFKSLMVVGDDCQAIYGFRGTSPENMIHFEEKIGMACNDLYLSVNHRSLAPIVDLGNRITSSFCPHCIEKVMTASRPDKGEKPVLYGFASKNTEPEFIAKDIKKRIDAGEKPEDIAVIARNKAGLKAVSKELAKLEVFAQYDMKEDMLANGRVRAAIALCKYIRSNASAEFMLFLNELYGNTFLSIDGEVVNKLLESNQIAFRKLWDDEEMEEDKKKEYLLSLLSSLDDKTDAVYTAFLEKIKEKRSYLAKDLADYIVKFETYNSTEGAMKAGEYEAVALVTAHSSKGKEWKRVYFSLSGFDHGNLSNMEEDWRLVYVGVTRARDFLTITSLRDRGRDGDSVFPNRFFMGIKGILGESKISDK